MDAPNAIAGPNGPGAQDLGEGRTRIVNSIMKDLKKLVLVSVPASELQKIAQQESKLQKIAQQYEEKIYTAAIDESDYLRTITQQMDSMKRWMKAPAKKKKRWMKAQQKRNPGNAQVIQNQKPPGPAPGFPPPGSNPVSVCQGAPNPPQIHCSPQAAEALVNHACPVPVNGDLDVWAHVNHCLDQLSPPPAPSSPANYAGSVFWGDLDDWAKENHCLDQFSPDVQIIEPVLDNPSDLHFPVPDAAAAMADPTLPKQEPTLFSTPPIIMVPTPPSAAPAPATPPASPYLI